MIDTGKIIDSNIECIYEYCGKQRAFFDLPPRCFECSLAQLQPSQVRYLNGFWPNEAIELFKQQTTTGPIEIEVLSLTYMINDQVASIMRNDFSIARFTR